MNVHQLLAYDEWATTQLSQAAQTLSPSQFAQEFSGASVRNQFAHLLLVTDRYRARLQGEAVPDTAPKIVALDDLLEYAAQVRQRLNGFAAKISDEKLHDIVEHATRQGVFRFTVEDTLQHIVNHATYHRGQIACLLKLHGADFPDTDLVFWLRDFPPQATAP